jgi:hypothetical protein
MSDTERIEHLEYYSRLAFIVLDRADLNSRDELYFQAMEKRYESEIAYLKLIIDECDDERLRREELMEIFEKYIS